MTEAGAPLGPGLGGTAFEDVGEGTDPAKVSQLPGAGQHAAWAVAQRGQA